MYGTLQNGLSVPANNAQALTQNPLLGGAVEIVMATPLEPTGNPHQLWCASKAAGVGLNQVDVRCPLNPSPGGVLTDVWMRRVYSKYDCGPAVNGLTRVRGANTPIQNGVSNRSSHFNVVIPAADLTASIDVVLTHNLHVVDPATQLVVELFPTSQQAQGAPCLVFVSAKATNTITLTNGAGGLGGTFDVVVHAIMSPLDIGPFVSGANPQTRLLYGKAGQLTRPNTRWPSYRSVHLGVSIPAGGSVPGQRLITHELLAQDPNRCFISLCPTQDPQATDVYVADKIVDAAGRATLLENVGRSDWEGDVIVWNDLSNHVGRHV